MVTNRDKTPAQQTEEYLNGLSPSAPPETTAPNGEPAVDPGWFASLDTRRIDLGGGRWIEIHDELTYREQSSLVSAGVKARPNPRDPNHPDYYIDNGEFDLAKIKTWVVDWNARDRAGNPIPFIPEAVDDLEVALARAILDAIEKHQAALEARKNPSSPATRSSS